MSGFGDCAFGEEHVPTPMPAGDLLRCQHGKPEASDSVLDPIVHVGHTGLSLEDPGTLQLDLPGSETLEQLAPLAEDHWDDMQLEFVEDSGRKCEPRADC